MLCGTTFIVLTDPFCVLVFFSDGHSYFSGRDNAGRKICFVDCVFRSNILLLTYSCMLSLFCRNMKKCSSDSNWPFLGSYKICISYNEPLVAITTCTCTTISLFYIFFVFWEMNNQQLQNLRKSTSVPLPMKMYLLWKVSSVFFWSCVSEPLVHFFDELLCFQPQWAFIDFSQPLFCSDTTSNIFSHLSSTLSPSTTKCFGKLFVFF